MSTTSNRLNSVSGALTRTYVYDNAGNTTSDGSATFVYNDAGRMISATKAGVTTSYAFNGFGQRVRKTTSGASTYFVYDEAGHLLGEYDNAGNLIQETVWIGDTPVAALNPNGGGVEHYYVHSDHLNAPRKITAANNALRWRWDSKPFGVGTPDSNPQGLGAFDYNLRFPGQYFDAETGLHYNYFRDYDAQAGRYVQSDPIGLNGGLNTFTYAGAGPIGALDRLGLFAIPWFPVLPPPVVGAGDSEGGVPPLGGVVAQGLQDLAEGLKEKICPDNKCPPCKTITGKIVAVGTIAYRPLDVLPDDVVEHGVAGSHHNIFQANQYPYPKCDCFWQKKKDVKKPGELLPQWMLIEPFVNPPTW